MPEFLSAEKPSLSSIERLEFLHSECRFRHCAVDRHEECPHYFGITYPED